MIIKTSKAINNLVVILKIMAMTIIPSSSPSFMTKDDGNFEEESQKQTNK